MPVEFSPNSHDGDGDGKRDFWYTCAMRRRLAAGAIAASLVGGGFAAVVFGPVLADAQESDASESEAPGSESSDGEARDRHNPPWIAEALDQLVSDGVIDQSQATAVAEALIEARPPKPGGGGGWGPGGPHHPGHPGFMGRGLEAAAETIGIEVDAVREALRDGQSLAEIATANGSSAQAVIDALVAEANAHIDEKVAEGDMDAATAEEAKARVAEGITAMINGEVNGDRPEGWGPGNGRGRGHGFGPPGHAGPGHPDDPEEPPDPGDQGD